MRHNFLSIKPKARCRSYKKKSILLTTNCTNSKIKEMLLKHELNKEKPEHSVDKIENENPITINDLKYDQPPITVQRNFYAKNKMSNTSCKGSGNGSQIKLQVNEPTYEENISKQMHNLKKMESPKRMKYLKEHLRHPLLPIDKVDDDEYKDFLFEMLRANNQLKKAKEEVAATPCKFGVKRNLDVCPYDSEESYYDNLSKEDKEDLFKLMSGETKFRKRKA